MGKNKPEIELHKKVTGTDENSPGPEYRVRLNDIVNYPAEQQRIEFLRDYYVPQLQAFISLLSRWQGAKAGSNLPAKSGLNDILTRALEGAEMQPDVNTQQSC